MRLPIIILGPCCSGKTTVAKLLAAATGLPRYSLDKERWSAYEQLGMNLSEDEALQEGSFENLLTFRKPYDLQVVLRSVDAYPDGIIEFGAAHGYWDNPEQLGMVTKALATTPNRFLLMPNRDQEISIEVLRGRLKEREGIHGLEEVMKVTANMVRCQSYAAMSSHVVFTDGKEPPRVVEEIMNYLI